MGGGLAVAEGPRRRRSSRSGGEGRAAAEERPQRLRTMHDSEGPRSRRQRISLDGSGGIAAAVED